MPSVRPNSGSAALEIARQTGISKSSAQRVARDLVDNGLLERDGTRYRLGLHLFELGQRVPRRRDLRDAAAPFMSDLREATGHSVHLAGARRHVGGLPGRGA